MRWHKNASDSLVCVTRGQACGMHRHCARAGRTPWPGPACWVPSPYPGKRGREWHISLKESPQRLLSEKEYGTSYTYSSNTSSSMSNAERTTKSAGRSISLHPPLSAVYQQMTHTWTAIWTTSRPIQDQHGTLNQNGLLNFLHLPETMMLSF